MWLILLLRSKEIAMNHAHYYHEQKRQELAMMGFDDSAILWTCNSDIGENKDGKQVEPVFQC